jgi:uncharacterized membrane protein YdjX (TVP38/TMEM64 family)
MSDGRQLPRPSELIYMPGSSWLPAFAAAGVAGVLVGLFAGWPYAVAAGILGVAAVWTWVRRTGDEIARLPRRQRLTSAVLPAVPLSVPDDES